MSAKSSKTCNLSVAIDQWPSSNVLHDSEQNFLQVQFSTEAWTFEL